MSTSVPSEKMHMAGMVLSWLTGSAVAGVLAFFLALLCGNANPQALLAQLINRAAPVLIFGILAAEAGAVVFLLIGVVRWPARIVRSPRWVLSAVGSVLVAAAILLAVYIYLVTVTSLV